VYTRPGGWLMRAGWLGLVGWAGLAHTWHGHVHADQACITWCYDQGGLLVLGAWDNGRQPANHASFDRTQWSPTPCLLTAPEEDEIRPKPDRTHPSLALPVADHGAKGIWGVVRRHHRQEDCNEDWARGLEVGEREPGRGGGGWLAVWSALVGW
jgi:hypothetical protein